MDKTPHNKRLNKDFSRLIKLLSDEQKIKIWIKTILSVQNNLPEIIKSVDKIIEVNASSLSFVTDIYNTEKSTFAQVEKVIDLTERKNKLLNLYLISKNLMSSVSENERLFLKRKYVFNWTADELAQEYSVSVRTVFRRLENLINDIFEKTKQKNWTIGFINMQVKNEIWLHERFNQFAKEMISSLLNKNSQTKSYKAEFNEKNMNLDNEKSLS